MKFEFFGVKIYISFLFTATVSFMLATDRTGLMIPTLFAVLIHEAGHLFAMWANDCAPSEIKLVPASVQIVEGYPRATRNEVWIIISGPLFNTAVAAALFINFYLSGAELSLKFALLNAVLAVFNLSPVTGLDGGRLITLIISRKTDINTAQRIVRIITFIFSAFAFLTGGFLLLHGSLNLSVFIVALYLLICAMMKC